MLTASSVGGGGVAGELEQLGGIMEDGVRTVSFSHFVCSGPSGQWSGGPRPTLLKSSRTITKESWCSSTQLRLREA